MEKTLNPRETKEELEADLYAAKYTSFDIALNTIKKMDSGKELEYRYQFMKAAKKSNGSIDIDKYMKKHEDITRYVDD